jgi:hypothetical protein
MSFTAARYVGTRNRGGGTMSCKECERLRAKLKMVQELKAKHHRQDRASTAELHNLQFDNENLLARNEFLERLLVRISDILERAL